MKQHTLAEHEEDVEKWWWENHQTSDPDQRRTMFFIAYERWVNDKPLLRDEDSA